MRIFFEHEALPALEGETVAAALTAAGILGLRRTREGAMRGVFCGMGVCFDCLVCIDGLPNQRACMTKVRAGMKVFPQAHVPALPPLPDSSLPDAPHQEVAERPCAILVVGAGPAGLAAAQAAAERGAKVTLLDERPEAGGQYYKQLAPSHRFAAGARKDRQFARGQALLDRVRNLGVAILNEATVWDAYAAVTEDGRTKLEIAMVAGGRAAIYTPQQLIVAAGAYERPFPVPGWTLPGVMTTGAAQTLSRAYRVSPGSRVLIAGNGPLNFQVACELARSGVEVVAVAETARRLGSSRLRSGLTAVLLSPGLIWEGLGYLKELHRHRIPVLYRHRLLEVTGKERAQQAIVVAVDEQGRQVSGIERAFSVDAVCMGYGFLPSTEITRLLGCSHRYEPGLGTLVVDCGENGATSRPGVYAVGDCRAIGGSQVALAQGTLAGLAAAEAIGLPAESGSTRRAARYLSRHRAFQRALWSLFEGPAFDDSAVGDDVQICRCENVRAGDLRRHLVTEAVGIGSVKRATRAGMGRCQGRYCAPYLARMSARRVGSDIDEYAFFAPRFPLRPLSVGSLAVEKKEWGGHPEIQPPPLRRPLPRRVEAERKADVIVIGAGILGACTAYFLAREGVDVAILDRGPANGEASGGNAGSLHVQLLSYDFGDRAQKGGLPAAATLPLQRDSARLWPALERELGANLEIAITGGLMVGEDEGTLDHLRRKAKLERSYGTHVEILSAADLRALAPHVSDRMIGAAWCPEEGKINPMLATAAVLAGAAKMGCRLFQNTEVQAIERRAGGYAAQTNRGAFYAPHVLNASGAWSANVASMVGLRLPTHGSPLQMIVTEPAAPLVEHLLAHANRHLTLKQAVNGNLIIGGGWTAALDPISLRPRVKRDSLEGNLWAAERVLPAVGSINVIRSWAAMNVVIDGAPILGEAPGHPGFFNAVTVNGLTMGPLIGLLNAEIIRTGRCSRNIAPYTLSRF